MAKHVLINRWILRASLKGFRAGVWSPTRTTIGLETTYIDHEFWTTTSNTRTSINTKQMLHLAANSSNNFKCTYAKSDIRYKNYNYRNNNYHQLKELKDNNNNNNSHKLKFAAKTVALVVVVVVVYVYVHWKSIGSNFRWGSWWWAMNTTRTRTGREPMIRWEAMVAATATAAISGRKFHFSCCCCFWRVVQFIIELITCFFSALKEKEQKQKRKKRPKQQQQLN